MGKGYMELIYGDGYGSGYGDGYGYGSGYGYGYGYGYGDGYGSGYGYGDGSGDNMELIKKFKWDSKIILHETNAEIRKEIIKTIDIVKVLKDLDAKVIDKKDNYELLNLNLQDGRFRPYLKMLNPSVGVWHVEGVHPDCETVEQALEWRNKTKEEPEVLT